MGGHRYINFQNFKGASSYFCIDFQKLGGGTGPPAPLVPAALLLKEVIYIRDKKKLRDFLDHAQMKQLGNIYYNVDNFSCGFPDHLESTKNLIEIKFGIGFFLHFIISVCKIIMVMISLFVSS